ncbi:MAG: RluA family pseudouridine synthase [Bacillota bacterium]|nr:MAG: RluA family pseudouridine synthase [Bacillota bacterium]
MVEIVSTKTIKLVKLLAENGVSFSAAQRVLRKRDVKVNGARVGEDVLLCAGDKVVAYIDAAPTHTLLYEDENILAVNKRKGVESAALFAELSSRGELYFIHRLDTNTDGVMLFAKNKTAERELLHGFKTRAFEKYYLAEVYGFFERDEGELCDYLVKDAASSAVKIYKTPVKGAAPVVTAYRVLEKREQTSLLEIRLVTGKTHQIRAHTAFYGHFVVGDGKYGKESVNRALKAKKQRLTAQRIVLHFTGGALAYLDGKTIERGN